MPKNDFPRIALPFFEVLYKDNKLAMSVLTIGHPIYLLDRI